MQDCSHVTLFLPPHVSAEIDAVRRIWDPAMAEWIAPHITVAYPHEHPGHEAMSRCLAQACQTIGPFELELAEYASFRADRELVIYVKVLDRDHSLARLRARLIRPGMTTPSFQPHVTVINPWTSPLAPRFLEAMPLHRDNVRVRVDTVHVTAPDGGRWRSVEQFRLGAQ